MIVGGGDCVCVCYCSCSYLWYLEERPLEIELQVLLDYLNWMPETVLRSSESAGHTGKTDPPVGLDSAGRFWVLRLILMLS